MWNSIAGQRTSGGRPWLKVNTSKHVMYGELLCPEMTSYIVTSLYTLTSASCKT